MKVQLNITATLELYAADVKLLEAASPQEQLSTAMAQGAKVTSTVERYQPKTRKVQGDGSTGSDDNGGE